jgi:hypothetical protein
VGKRWDGLTRREFLKATGAFGLVAGSGGPPDAQPSEGERCLVGIRHQEKPETSSLKGKEIGRDRLEAAIQEPHRKGRRSSTTNGKT